MNEINYIHFVKKYSCRSGRFKLVFRSRKRITQQKIQIFGADEKIFQENARFGSGVFSVFGQYEFGKDLWAVRPEILPSFYF